MIGKAVYAKLTDPAAATLALVGNDAQGNPNVYPDVNMAKGTRFVVYSADDGETGQTYSDGPDGLTKHKVVVSAVAANRLDCETLAEAIKSDLDGQRGTWGGVAVPGSFLDGGDAQFYPLTDGGERKLMAKDLEFLIWKQST